ncbi:MAG: MgtC/SapB family protein [Caulobacteraceae bacterium]|nr:MgtC/SapB family protein [Caulobacteraceae bacterium]
MAANLAAAWAAGSVIGLERTYNGRVAGFRTHAIVAVAAASAMLVAQGAHLRPDVFAVGTSVSLEAASRIAQGVMAGVGFLGAGVIFKEGVSVQGLTTAASLWATAAIGLLFGLGLGLAALPAVVLVLVTLTLMRSVEARLPSRVRAQGAFRFKADEAPDEAGFRDLLGRYAIILDDLSYGLLDDGRVFEYRAWMEDKSGRAFEALATRLRNGVPALVEFELERISK